MNCPLFRDLITIDEDKLTINKKKKLGAGGQGQVCVELHYAHDLFKLPVQVFLGILNDTEEVAVKVLIDSGECI